MRIQEITLVKIGWNEWNGFGISILKVEILWKIMGFYGSLFGFNIDISGLEIDILFCRIVIKSPIQK